MTVTACHIESWKVDTDSGRVLQSARETRCALLSGGSRLNRAPRRYYLGLSSSPVPREWPVQLLVMRRERLSDSHRRPPSCQELR